MHLRCVHGRCGQMRRCVRVDGLCLSLRALLLCMRGCLGMHLLGCRLRMLSLLLRGDLGLALVGARRLLLLDGMRPLLLGLSLLMRYRLMLRSGLLLGVAHGLLLNRLLVGRCLAMGSLLRCDVMLADGLLGLHRNRLLMRRSLLVLCRFVLAVGLMRLHGSLLMLGDLVLFGDLRLTRCGLIMCHPLRLCLLRYCLLAIGIPMILPIARGTGLSAILWRRPLEAGTLPAVELVRLGDAALVLGRPMRLFLLLVGLVIGRPFRLPRTIRRPLRA
jgi:hypothetical protein